MLITQQLQDKYLNYKISVDLLQIFVT